MKLLWFIPYSVSAAFSNHSPVKLQFLGNLVSFLTDKVNSYFMKKQSLKPKPESHFSLRVWVVFLMYTWCIWPLHKWMLAAYFDTDFFKVSISVTMNLLFLLLLYMCKPFSCGTTFTTENRIHRWQDLKELHSWEALYL